MKPRVRDTITRPSRNENIVSVCRVFHRHIWLNDSERKTDPVEQEKFNINNFVKRQYQVVLPWWSKAHAFSMFFQKPKQNKLPKPDVHAIYRFVKQIFDKAHLNAECAVIALIYTERLMEMKNVALTKENWIPIIMTSLLTASKVWDDLSSWNVEFSEIYPVFNLKTINRLEREFLGTLEYNLYVSGSVYAQYYFNLRALRSDPRRAKPYQNVPLNINGKPNLSRHATLDLMAGMSV